MNPKQIQANINAAHAQGQVAMFESFQHPAVRCLVERMRTYEDGTFDGYPSMSCHDETLIEAAAQALGMGDKQQMLAFVASEHMRDRNEYMRARAFYVDAATTCWECNMSEGSNEAHASFDE